ncbi:phytoene/squalene synthase family protein [Agrilutibacter solisilvae]|uniref:Phytoene/squalene synthase family protein n=1 Tax=Agrilutibacter solisilvae TaxID=2763317 RepID=A0A975ART8_9GAMM|nr:phytoene/squalene synthase family protein [Lysobacter solisilvae]QSX78037.1 phytoene/squalene synthase family protein [Lysobacter solisilvae]
MNGLHEEGERPPEGIDHAADRAADRGPDGVDSFLEKWRARWPEWDVAQVFVPKDQRPLVLAFASLLQELTDAAWGGSDRRPGEAKLGWWMEELHGWSRGARRHPLGLLLQKQQAPWGGMAAVLADLPASRERPMDAGQAQSQLQGLAESIAAIEPVLFPTHGSNPQPAEQAALTTLLHLRLAHHPGEAVPLEVMARDAGGALEAWRHELCGRERPGAGVPRPRRILAALALARLRRPEPARPLSPAVALLTAWRAARG